MEPHFSDRIANLRRMLDGRGLKGLILPPGPNLRYYTGGNSLLLERLFFMIIPVEGEPHLVTPKLEAGPYVRCPVKIRIHGWTDNEGPAKAMQEAVAELNLTGKWGMEGSMPFRFVDQLSRFAQPQLENADPILQGIRAIKDKQEVQLLTRSAEILSKSFLNIPGLIREGVSEVELAQHIAGEIHSNGAESVPDLLVQTGPMAADSHHLPSSRKLKRKESIVVDATCTYAGYFADITRTFTLGKDTAFERLYGKLLDAQIAAVEAARVGVAVSVVDNAARASLRAQKLDSYFVHRTGHGLGLEVHEAPYIVSEGSELLQPSMAFTVEPGVYLQGKTGLRIEDDLLTQKENCKVLTKLVPKEYGWWR